MKKNNPAPKAVGKSAPAKKQSRKKQSVRKQEATDELRANENKAKVIAPIGREFLARSFNLPDVNVHFIAPKDITKHYGDPSSPESKSYANVRARIGEDLDWLVRRATVHGESDAVLILAELGVDCAAYLAHLTPLQPDLLKKIARRVVEWPVIITAQENQPHNPNRVRKELSIGKDVVLRRDKTRYRHKEMPQRQVMYHVLSILIGVRTVVGATRKIEQLRIAHEKVSVSLSKDSTVDTAKHAAPFLAIFKGEQEKAAKSKVEQTAAVKGAKYALGEILGIPTTQLKTANSTVSQVLQRSCRLQSLTNASKEDWLDLSVALIVALTGDQLEESPKLRELGDFAGDFIIRENHCKRPNDLEEFKRLKVELRSNDRINNVIRQRIKDKLADALASFIT